MQENVLIPASRVRAICGGISDMSLWRWLADPTLDFPHHMYIRERRYWDEAVILEWVSARAVTSATEPRPPRPGEKAAAKGIA